MKGATALAILCLATTTLAALQACSDSSLDGAWHAAASSKWAADADEIEFQKFRLQTLISELPATNGETASLGRGVVIIASTKQHAVPVYVAVAKLRSVSSLPVEVFHVGSIDDVVTRELEVFSDVHVVALPEGQSLSMADAILLSSFNEVVAFDAQTLPLIDPATLFNSAEFQSTGLLMFPTLYKTASHNPVWNVLGRACIDSYEQSAAAIVVNRASAWKALNMAPRLRGGDFFRSLTNGEHNVMRLAALATDTAFNMDGVPRLVSSPYIMAGENKVCAHLTVYAVKGVDAFAVSANAIVEASGSSVPLMNCIDTESAVSDEALVSEYVRLFSAVPISVNKFRSMACVAGTLSADGIRTHAATTFAAYKVDLSTFARADVLTRTVPFVSLVAQCATLFSSFLPAARLADDLDVAFLNLTAGTGRSANVDIETKGANNILGGIQPFGNSTIMYVTNYNGRSSYSYPIFGLADTKINFNLATGTSAIVMVAFDAQRRHYQAPIAISFTYNGDSNGASSLNVSPAMMAVATALVIFAHKVFGF